MILQRRHNDVIITLLTVFEVISLMVTHGHSWSLVVTRVHSWSLVVIRGHSWSLVVTLSTFRPYPRRHKVASSMPAKRLMNE